MLNLCGVCRTQTADLISLKFNDEGTKRILYKLKSFISANIMDYDPYLTSFICLQCMNNLEIAFKFKKVCDTLNGVKDQEKH